MCASQDINNCDTIDIKCPNNTEIRELRGFGIEDKKGNETQCGGSVANSTSIELNILKGKKCDMPMYLEKKEYSDFANTAVEWFNKDCKGKNSCAMKIYDDAAYSDDCKNLITENGS
jgi:hypothetical protein